jgi:hypothetical protein
LRNLVAEVRHCTGPGPVVRIIRIQPLYTEESFPNVGRAFLPIILFSCFIPGCGESPAEPEFPVLDPEAGLLEGTIDGSTFQGTGHFSSTPDVRMGVGGDFHFLSIGVGPSHDESINGVWFNGEIPPPGSYSVSFPSLFQRGFWLFYKQGPGAGMVRYAADSGTIEIDSAASSEVRGSFHVSARPCADADCRESAGGDTDSETIELSGTFRLVPLDPLFVPL